MEFRAIITSVTRKNVRRAAQARRCSGRPELFCVVVPKNVHLDTLTLTQE